jgi:thiamine-phosphate pyrophosphorylase
LSAICKAVPIPVVAIGGLNLSNLDILKGSGADGIAVVSAIMKAENPRKAAEELLMEVKQL